MDEDGPRSQRVPRGGGADLISALPEDLLLQVLVRLRCARAAARTSLLARRWRGLWTRLPDLVFRDVAARSILRALTSLQGADGPGVSLLDIRVPGRSQKAARLCSLLHAAAGLSPAELRFARTHNLYLEDIDVDLSSFQRATSIELRLRGPNLLLKLSPRFLALERLTLSGCSFDLAALFPRCPCLRVLKLADNGYHTDDITIRSEWLEELDVESPY